MLPRSLRVVGKDFHTLKFKQVLRGKLGILKVAHSHKRAFGVVVSTRVAKKAVERNKLKRRGRHLLTLFSDHIPYGYTLVFYPYSSMLKYPWDEVVSVFNSDIKQLRF